jgi:hypothetical protein
MKMPNAKKIKKTHQRILPSNPRRGMLRRPGSTTAALLPQCCSSPATPLPRPRRPSFFPFFAALHPPASACCPVDQEKELSRVTDSVCETLCDEALKEFKYKEFYNVFKNNADCLNLKNKVMATLTPPAVTAAVPNPLPVAAPVAVSVAIASATAAIPETPVSPTTPPSATT